MDSQPVLRFAPSPTGFLHIGGARTALFNWLLARHMGGKFLLRIEDTDRARSTQAAVDAILDGLSWLGLDWDGEVVYQSTRAVRHAEMARKLLAEGRAYLCFCTPAELEAMRAEQKAAGLSTRYDGRWRDRDPATGPADVKPVVRLKAPLEGETVVRDHVRGEVRVANAQLDDMVLLRGDGSPTYMLSVVVDDHDMGITHVVRGDDHFTNTFRQIQLYNALGWSLPEFAHIPLIHGADGAKLSKRHGALGVEAYRDMGFLPEALRNYLMRLGWSHGDEEIISTEQAIEWFGFGGMGASAARFDLAKLTNLNAHYLRQMSDAALAEAAAPRLAEALSIPIDATAKERLARAMPSLKGRARTLVELADISAFYVRQRPIPLDDKAKKLLDAPNLEFLRRFAKPLAALQNWRQDDLEGEARRFAEEVGVPLASLAQPLRAALSGRVASPPIFEVMEILGRDESLARIDNVLGADVLGSGAVP